MWRLLPLVVVLAWPAAAGPSCVTLAAYDAAVAAADRTTRAHFDDALAKRKLKPVQLPLAE